MKRFLPFLLAITIPAGAAARNIDANEAAAIASDFMQQLTPGKATLTRAPLRGVTPAQAQPFYIYNNPAGGYVIVSGDDRLGSVLAYSTDGYISTENAPEGLADLLSMYETAYKTVSTSADASTAFEAPLGTPQTVVEPILGGTNWGQDTPFNLYTPTYTSGTTTTHYYTGCVACAATQIMRHYAWPTKGSGSKTYTDPLSGKTLSADFGATTYNWADMPAIVPDQPTEAQANAYSTLAAQMGVALEMQYEASGSGTYDMLVPYALRTYFGYDKAVRSHNRLYYSTNEWMEIIKDELNAGRPVFYGGSSDSGNGGHAFVLDGYDSNGMVHVNWGWYGNSNGYFMINHLDPSSLGAGGGAGGYNLNQDMVTGIQTPQEGSVSNPAIYGATRLSVDGPFGGTFVLMTYIENIDVDPYTGNIDALLIDAQGNIVTSLGSTEVTVPGFANGYSGNLLYNPKNVTASVSGVPDGTYRLCLGYTTEGTSTPTILRHPKGLPAYADVKVSRGIISITGKHVPAPDGILTEPITTDGDLYAGGIANVNFTVENRSSDFVISAITLRLTSVDNPSVSADATIAKTIYDQSTETVSLLMPVDPNLPTGKYRLSALVKSGDEEYPFEDTQVGSTIVTVLPISETPVIRMASQMEWKSGVSDAPEGYIAQGQMFYGVVAVRNAGSKGTANILCRFVNTETGESSPFLQQAVTFEDNPTRTVTFGRYMPFDPGTYRVEFYQVGEDFSEKALMAFGTTPIVTVSSSDGLMAEMVELSMPDKMTQGVREQCSLTYRGLKAGRQSLYIRVRRFTNSGGEIAYMGSQAFEPGVTKEVSFKYTPGATLADGLYMVIAETGSSSAQTPMGNYAAYGKVITIGNVSGIDAIEAAQSAVAVWAEGYLLHVVPAAGRTVDTVRLFSTSGALVNINNFDLSSLSAGIYIAQVTLDNGTVTTAKIVLR